MLVEDIRVSVIIPIYNVENYLQKCLDSVIKQSYSNLEIILVDDGSTDLSGKICEEYKEIDKRIKVVHKENEGTLFARKKGVEIATGKYILNLDGDDWIENNMIEELLTLALKSDAEIVSSGIYYDWKNSAIKNNDNLEEGLYQQEHQLEYLHSNLIYCGSVEKQGILAYLVLKLIKTELLKKIYSQVNKRIIYGEDLAITCLCCMEAKSIYITYKAYYHYVKRQTSVTNSRGSYFLVQIKDLYDFMKKKLLEKENGEYFLKQFELVTAHRLVIAINKYMGLGEHVRIPYYFFSKNFMLPNDKIILYGAGNVGQDYYKQISLNSKCEVVKWVDKNFQKYREKNLNVDSIESIANVEYDYIIIAIKSKETSEEIKEQLINTYGVNSSKIKWIEPINIIDKYCLNE